jgi:hypothetical protein
MPADVAPAAPIIVPLAMALTGAAVAAASPATLPNPRPAPRRRRKGWPILCLEYWKSFHERVPIMSAFVRRILPPAVMILGIVVITAWVSLLAYGIATLVEAL